MNKEEAKKLALRSIKGLAKVSHNEYGHERVFAYGRDDITSAHVTGRWMNLENRGDRLILYTSNGVPKSYGGRLVKADPGLAIKYHSCYITMDREMTSRMIANMQQWLDVGSLNLGDTTVQSDVQEVTKSAAGMYLWEVKIGGKAYLVTTLKGLITAASAAAVKLSTDKFLTDGVSSISYLGKIDA